MLTSFVCAGITYSSAVFLLLRSKVSLKNYNYSENVIIRKAN
jgi:hypothetical protein